MAEQENSSLLARSGSQGSVETGVNTGRRRCSDLTIAGAVFLVCTLIAGQGLTAYFLIRQRDQMSALEDTTKLLNLKLAHMPRGVSTGSKARLTMLSAPMLKMRSFSELAELEELEKLQKSRSTPRPAFKLPQFNESFVANLLAHKERTEPSEWEGFESWMRHWLLFQKARNPAPTPIPAATMSATSLQTKCQIEAGGKVWPGVYRPACDEQGDYLPLQCQGSTGYCWCVTKDGVRIPETLVRGRPTCGNIADE